MFLLPTGFTEGSVNVIFKVITIEEVDSVPTEEEVLSTIQDTIVSKDKKIGDFVVDETSVVVSKYFLMK